jgi:curved DNA-binding protein CbpA
LYDILEVSDKASPEVIHAAYERQSRLWAPGGARSRAPDAQLRYAAVRDAFLTLADPAKRIAYDARLRRKRRQPVRTRFWTLPKVSAAFVLLVGPFVAYNYYTARHELTRAEAQKADALRKAKEDAARSKAAAEQRLAR